MKKYIFFIIIVFLPFVILAVFFFRPATNHLKSDFSRKIFSNQNIIAKDTFRLTPGVLVDGISIDKNNIWLNQRFSLAQLGKGSIERIIVPGKNSSQKGSIVNFYVENDSVYYLQANARKICEVDLRDSLISDYNFSFPITYFIKMKGYSFLFQENLLGNGVDRLHFKDFKNGVDYVNDTVFSKDIGSGMKYSGAWFSSLEKTNFFFVPQYEDNILCFDLNGKLKYKIKAIDFQNQKLEIIQEGGKFFLTPHAIILRQGACASKNNLFVSSYVYARNQSKKDFINNLTIDVYQIRDGKYKYSFYLPDLLGKKATDFVISDNLTLYALYPRNIILYDLINFLKDGN